MPLENFKLLLTSLQTLYPSFIFLHLWLLASGRARLSLCGRFLFRRTARASPSPATAQTQWAQRRPDRRNQHRRNTDVTVMGLTKVVASVAVLPAALGWALRPFVPLPVTLVLYHVAATGFTVAAAAWEPFTQHTRWILGKVESPERTTGVEGEQAKNGKLQLWGKMLFWPYHVGIRLRLMVQKRIPPEPRFHEIAPGWCSRA